MWIFIDVRTTVECLLTALGFACFLTVVWFRPLGILQSLGYKNVKFLNWAGKKSNLAQARFSVLALATVLFCAVISLCFSFIGRWSAVCGLAAYVVFFSLYIYSEAKHTVKGSAALTPRFKRLLATTWVITAILVYLAASALNFAAYVWKQPVFDYLKYCALSLFPLASLLIMCLANLIAFLWEAPVNAYYVKKAKNKLAAAGLTVVGITGSFAKTSAKNILTAMLSSKYKTLSTPSSYNTPLGIAKTLNSQNLSEYQVLIAEMGARHAGDIEELCRLCPPDYSLITGICPQHLESFKTLENIVAAKAEIIAATKGKCFISPAAYKYFQDFDGDTECADCVSDVVADRTGTAFKLKLGGKGYAVKTKLLGKHSAYNIGLCARLAYEMGVPAGDIAEVIGTLDYTEHRLQLLESNGVSILDDGYNSNVVGAKAAIEVLKYFGGKKICVTPGLVELGVLEEKENAALGKELVGLDFVILVGETLVKAVLAGYVEGGGDEEKITVVPTLTAAQDILKQIIAPGDAVLFLNDLPEQYM